MQLYNVATQTEIRISLPKVVNKKVPDWRGAGRRLGILTNELSKFFPDKSDGRGNGMTLWPAQSKQPELQSNRPQNFDYRTVLFGQATV